MTDGLAELADIVAKIAAELGCGLREGAVECVERDGLLVVTVAGRSAPLDPANGFLMLDLEIIIDRMERMTEEQRMMAAVRAASADATAPWLVHTERFVRDWLVWNGGGHSGAAWFADRRAITTCASSGGGRVTVPVRRSVPGAVVDLSITRGRISCRLPLLSGAEYSSTASEIILAGLLPEALAISLDGGGEGSNSVALLGDHFDMSGGLGKATPISVENRDDRGRIRLHDDLVPLAPMPHLAVKGIASPGPAYAPWRIAEETWHRVNLQSRRAYAL